MRRRQNHGRQKHIDIDEFANSGSLTIMRAPGEIPGAEPPPPDPLALTATSVHYGMRVPKVRKELDRGKTLLCEVLLVAVMMMLGLAGIAGQFVSDRWTATHAYRQSLAQDLLQETVQALHAYSFDALASLHGSVVHDGGNPQYSDFKVEIAVAPSKGGKLCIKTVLRDMKTLGKITELVTYREQS